MDSSKRNFLKLLPLAAMGPAAVEIGESRGLVYEMQPEKRYLIVVDSIQPDNAAACRQMLSERGINATIVSGVEDLTIYELQ